MGHIAHLRKQLKSINTYYYIITLIKWRKKTPIFNFWDFYGSSFEQTWITFTQRCFVPIWNWPSGSGEEDFSIFSLYFRYFVIISPWKKVGPFISTNLSSHYPRIHCAKFGWNWPSGSGEEFFLISSMYFRKFRYDLPLEKSS